MPKKAAILAFMALAIALPVAALAQSSSRSYCEQLRQLYARYVGTRQADYGGHPPTMPNATGDLAAESCGSNPGAAIPILERKLAGAGISLPRR